MLNSVSTNPVSHRSKPRPDDRVVIALVSLMLLLVVACSGPGSSSPDEKDLDPAVGQESLNWVAAWAASPYSGSENRGWGGKEIIFSSQTLRMIAVPHMGGQAVRLRFSNRFQASPVTFDEIYVGLRGEGAAVQGGTNQQVTVSGESSITLFRNSVVLSDPIRLPVRPFEPLAVSFHIVGPTTLDLHEWGLQTSYLTPAGTGPHSRDATGAPFTERTSSLFAIDAIDVLADRPTRLVVAFGDSITDGYGTTPDANRRWPDQLSRILLEKSGTEQVSVVNAGVSGNQLTDIADHRFPGYTGTRPGAWGLAGVSRFDADVLSMIGVTDVIQFNGGNDIVNGAPAERIIIGMRSLITRARSRCLNIVGVTLPPRTIWSKDPNQEATRQSVNQWIRASGEYDAVADFDSAVRDPQNPVLLLPRYDSGDGIHPNDEGHLAMARAIDAQQLLRPSRADCRRRS